MNEDLRRGRLSSGAGASTNNSSIRYGRNFPTQRVHVHSYRLIVDNWAPYIYIHTHIYIYILYIYIYIYVYVYALY